MKQKNIFREDFLKAYLNCFHLSKIDGIEAKKEILNDWFQRYKSGKLNNRNETSIGADFINDVFGDVLGFNYGNPNYWNLEKELKTAVDGKKPDGAIGYFNVNEELTADIHGIIELKDVHTDLDKAQKRTHDKRSPIEQAFFYAPKYGEKCRWIIVSNFIEIRLYQANDATKYESFHLTKLQDESELKRFFFLLLKEHLLSKDGTSKLGRLIKKNNEAKDLKNSDESSHLLDRIYNLIRKFDGLSYVNLNILVNAKPFNNTNKNIYNYKNFFLKSREEGIYNFFREIKIESQKIVLSEKLELELREKKVTEYKNKIHFIIKRLNDFNIFYIAKDYAGQLKKYPINLGEKNKVYNYLHYSYQRLDFTTVLKILKTREGSNEHYTLESAYFHYILGTNNFKTSFLIYKKIAKREKDKNDFIFFIAKYNLCSLYNLIDSKCELDDKEKIIKEIKSIDLDFIFHELDVIDPEKRSALMEIKNKSIERNVEKIIEENMVSLEKVKSSFKKGRGGDFPNYTFQLNQSLARLSLYYSNNYILNDIFINYKKICEKILTAYLISYSIDEDYHGRLKEFEIYHINLIIFNLLPDTVEKLFKDYCIDEIILSEEAKTDLLEKTKNYLQSNHLIEHITLCENNYLIELLLSGHFKDIYEKIFCNLFFLLSRIKLEEKECVEFIPTLINFLKIDKTLCNAKLKILSKFISKNGNYFTPKELLEILELTIAKEINDNDFIESICLSLHKFYSEFQITNQFFLQKVILHIKKHKESYEYLVPFWLISDNSNKAILEKEFFEKLDAQFDPIFYQMLLSYKIVNVDFKDYFDKYVKWVNESKGNSAYKLIGGEPKLNNYVFFNFALLIYDLNIDTNDKRVKQLTNLCDCHEWLINLSSFNYSKFKSEWVLLFTREIFLKRFSQFPQIRDKVKETLKKEYHLLLAEVFIKYLS